LSEPERLNEKTRLGLPITLALSLLASAITGTAAAVTAVYGLRDRTLMAVEQRLERSQAALRQERADALQRYLTREQFLSWREGDRIRQDANLHKILSAIDRLSEQVRRR
jgi:hypothetical protein